MILRKDYLNKLISWKDEQVVLTMDRNMPGNYEGIRVIHLLDWLVGSVD